MSVIRAKAIDRKLKLEQKPQITSGSKNIDSLEVELDASWINEILKCKDAKLKASFQKSNDLEPKIINMHKLSESVYRCEMKSSVISTPGMIHFGIFAENEEKDIIKTTDVVDYFIKQGAITDGEHIDEVVLTPEYWYERNEESWI